MLLTPWSCVLKEKLIISASSATYEFIPHLHTVARISVNLVIQLLLCLPSDFLSSVFQSIFLTHSHTHTLHITPIRAACPVHLILLHLVDLIAFGEEWKLWIPYSKHFLPHPLLPLFLSSVPDLIKGRISVQCSSAVGRFHLTCNKIDTNCCSPLPPTHSCSAIYLDFSQLNSVHC